MDVRVVALHVGQAVREIVGAALDAMPVLPLVAYVLLDVELLVRMLAVQIVLIFVERELVGLDAALDVNLDADQAV